MIKLSHRGSFKNSENFLTKVQKIRVKSVLDKYGRRGVAELAKATPIDTGNTASLWSFDIYVSNTRFSISWKNSNVNNGVPVAILLQYGHGTRNGGYVQGRDYINPTLKPIFDNLADEAWKEITKL